MDEDFDDRRNLIVGIIIVLIIAILGFFIVKAFWPRHIPNSMSHVLPTTAPKNEIFYPTVTPLPTTVQNNNYNGSSNSNYYYYPIQTSSSSQSQGTSSSSSGQSQSQALPNGQSQSQNQK